MTDVIADSPKAKAVAASVAIQLKIIKSHQILDMDKQQELTKTLSKVYSLE